MKEIAKEINKLAEEIKGIEIPDLSVPKKSVSVREKISLGFSIISLQEKKYAFKRFFILADPEEVSEQAKKLYDEIVEEGSELDNILNTKDPKIKKILDS